MQELAKTFIGKMCIIYTLKSQITGMLKEVTDGAILVDMGKSINIINLDYIIRISQYPKTKKEKDYIEH